MANNFSNDSSCKALYRFESGALATDSKGGNTLTETASPAVETTTHKEGSHAADFTVASAQALYIADASLDAGFPLKSGDATKVLLFTGWVRFKSVSTEMVIFAKHDTNGKLTLKLYSVGYGGWGVGFGYNTGNTYQYITFSPVNARAANKWYHVALAVRDSDKSFLLRVWDDAAGSYEDCATVNYTNALNVEDSALSLGCIINNGSPNGGYLGGQLDDCAFFNDVLDMGANLSTKINAIRAGTYTATTAPANVKVVGGLAIASVKSVQGLAISSVKTIEGLN